MIVLGAPAWRQIGTGPANVSLWDGAPVMLNQTGLGDGQVLTREEGAMEMIESAPIWAAVVWLNRRAYLTVQPLYSVLNSDGEPALNSDGSPVFRSP